jgi:hypothetical protein
VHKYDPADEEEDEDGDESEKESKGTFGPVAVISVEKKHGLCVINDLVVRTMYSWLPERTAWVA